jgi:hypothetical protein
MVPKPETARAGANLPAALYLVGEPMQSLTVQLNRSKLPRLRQNDSIRPSLAHLLAWPEAEVP